MASKRLILMGIVGILAGTFLNLFLSIPLLLVAALLGFIILLLGLFDYPLHTLLAVLGVRMLLDTSSEVGISVFSFSLNVSGLMALGIIAAAIVYFLIKGIKVFKKEFLPLLIFLAFSFFTIFESFTPLNSLADFIRFSSFGSIFLFAFVISKDQKTYHQFLAWFPLILLIPTLVALYQVATGTGYLMYTVYKPIGTFFHPNYLGYASLTGLTIMSLNVLNLFKKRNSTTRFVARVMCYTLFGLVSLYFIFASGSLGARLAFFLTVGIFFLLLANKKLILIPLLILLLAAIFPLVNFSLERKGIAIANSTTFQQLIGEAEEQGSFLWRVKNWESMFGFIREKPLAGWGLATYKPLRATQFEYHTDLTALEAHNDYMNFMVETGIIGVLLLMGMFLYYLGAILSSKPQASQMENPHPSQRPQQLLIASLLLATMIAMGVENIFKGASIMWPLFALIGATISVNSQQLTVNKKPTPGKSNYVV